MKIRTDFVTNSSSSSFICEVCGAKASGWDMTLNEANMLECENGHTFCRDEALKVSRERLIQSFKDLGIDSDDDMDEDQMVETLYDYDYGSDIPECFCPICQLQVATDRDVAQYFLKKHGMTKSDLLAEWKKEFGTLSKLKEFFELRKLEEENR